jgi:hypothetical protein
MNSEMNIGKLSMLVFAEVEHQECQQRHEKNGSNSQSNQSSTRLANRPNKLVASLKIGLMIFSRLRGS